MGNTVVVYASKYGATQKYAEWLSATLHCDLLERSTVKPEQLLCYDTIIYGGGLYAGGINGVSLIVKHYEELRDKRLAVFTVGLADPQESSNVAGIQRGIAKVFSTEMREKITFFHLRGAIDYKALGPMHKMMMAMLKNMVAKKKEDELSEEDKAMLRTYGQKVDFTDVASLNPLIQFAK